MSRLSVALPSNFVELLLTPLYISNHLHANHHLSIVASTTSSSCSSKLSLFVMHLPYSASILLALVCSISDVVARSDKARFKRSQPSIEDLPVQRRDALPPVPTASGTSKTVTLTAVGKGLPFDNHAIIARSSRFFITPDTKVLNTGSYCALQQSNPASCPDGTQTVIKVANQHATMVRSFHSLSLNFIPILPSNPPSTNLTTYPLFQSKDFNKPLTPPPPHRTPRSYNKSTSLSRPKPAEPPRSTVPSMATSPSPSPTKPTTHRFP